MEGLPYQGDDEPRNHLLLTLVKNIYAPDIGAPGSLFRLEFQYFTTADELHLIINSVNAFPIVIASITINYPTFRLLLTLSPNLLKKDNWVATHKTSETSVALSVRTTALL